MRDESTIYSTKKEKKVKIKFKRMHLNFFQISKNFTQKIWRLCTSWDIRASFKNIFTRVIKFMSFYPEGLKKIELTKKITFFFFYDPFYPYFLIPTEFLKTKFKLIHKWTKTIHWFGKVNPSTQHSLSLSVSFIQSTRLVNTAITT